MKNVLSALVIVLSTQHALACLGEAQIIGRVNAVQMMGTSACFVGLDPQSISFYQENKVCPLDLSTVLHAGIEVGLHKEDTCSLLVGDSLNGIIFKDVDGTIRIER